MSQPVDPRIVEALAEASGFTAGWRRHRFAADAIRLLRDAGFEVVEFVTAEAERTTE